MEKSPSLRIAHLSDPHFSTPSFSLNQFLSKRWIGNLNLLLFRKRAYQTEHLWHLPELLETLKVEATFITGDFSTTSLDTEFSEAKRLASAFAERNLPLYVVPGNHDCYTRESQRNRRFYSFFPSAGLQENRVESTPLGKGWWSIALDCAVAAPPFCAYGKFFKATEHYLREALLKIPSHENVIITNHFPLFTTGRPEHDLKRAEELQELLHNFPQVKLYLHGHDHTYYVVDLQREGFPLVLNSGSCAHKPDGTFFLIDLFETECLIQRLLFRKEKESFTWVVDWQRNYPFNRKLTNPSS